MPPKKSCSAIRKEKHYKNHIFLLVWYLQTFFSKTMCQMIWGCWCHGAVGPFFGPDWIDVRYVSQNSSYQKIHRITKSLTLHHLIEDQLIYLFFADPTNSGKLTGAFDKFLGRQMIQAEVAIITVVEKIKEDESLYKKFMHLLR